MSEGLTIIVFIVSISLGFVLLIYFFQLVNDVRKIKKTIASEDREYYRYIGLAKEEHYLGNLEKEREYLIRAQSHALYSEQDIAVEKLLKALDGKEEDEK